MTRSPAPGGWAVPGQKQFPQSSRPRVAPASDHVLADHVLAVTSQQAGRAGPHLSSSHYDEARFWVELPKGTSPPLPRVHATKKRPCLWGTGPFRWWGAGGVACGLWSPWGLRRCQGHEQRCRRGGGSRLN